MAEILSNQFTTTISRPTQASTKQILSNQFTATISRESEVPATLGDDLSTVINIYKKGILLTPVSGIPTADQYAVTITGTTRCTATLEDDNKTIKLLTLTGNTGRIDVSINIENKETYIKSIPVASITGTQQISGAMSKIEQKADKINLLVQGETASKLTMTDTFTELISNNITLTAEHINLNGYVSNNDANWSIDNEGNINAENLNIDRKLSVDTIAVNNIDSPKYPGVLTENLKLSIGESGRDESPLEDECVFQTFEGLLDKLPKNLNGHEVLIEMFTDITENIEFRGYHGGRIRILTKGYTIYGHVRSVMGSAKITIHSGHIGDINNTDRGWGKIHPSKGCAVGNYTATVACHDPGCIALYNIDVYGADNYLSGSTNKVGVAASDFGSVYMNEVSFYGCDIGARANAGGRIHDTISYNVCAKYGWVATTGGYITLAGNSHSGGKTANYQEKDGGKVIIGGDATFVGGNVSVPSTSAPVKSTKTVTIKSKSGDTYRSSVYNNWKKDNTVRQGDYGYGDCNGIWLFGNQFEQFKDKNITKVVITISRQEGGQYADVALNIKTHNYKTKPSGKPSYVATVGTLNLAVNNSGSKTITDTSNAIITGLKAGTIKGIGLQSTFDKSHYAVCSGSVTIKVTYSE